ncbi:MAG: type I restriction-modification system subunit M [Candidatus Omnitrophica bacterium]|nr:type I restriction-modification system subunit M [Candidatus Omnitrophota bacterium]
MSIIKLRSYIDKLWNKFWSGGISNPLTAIEQISYLLFMRRLDEEEVKRKRDADYLNEKYKSIFDGTFTLPNTDIKIKKETLRWSHFKQMQPDEMLAHMQTKVFLFIKQLNKEDSPFTKHMQDAVFLIPKPSLLVEAVNIIDLIYAEMEKDFEEGGDPFTDTQGDMYEYLLSEIATAGKNGQFRTPRHIIKLICELVIPKLGDVICDPACGTAGFLLESYQYILTQHTTKKYLKESPDGFWRSTLADKLTDSRIWKQLREKTFYGYDFEATMVRLSLMNLLLHGITCPQIDRVDTLSKKYNEDNKYDVMLANPPFKGNIDKGDINEGFSLATTKTELLFVNRIYTSLKVGGRSGVIVPDGVLFGSSKAHTNLRKMLIEKCELQGIVSMPSGVFKPYAGVSTAILIFTKVYNITDKEHKPATDKVWFYDMTSDGYSLDDKRTKLDEKPLPDIVTAWKERNKQAENDRTAQSFFVSAKEIIANKYDLSINRYKEIVYEEVKYDKPEVILGDILALEKEIIKGIELLKKEVENV